MLLWDQSYQTTAYCNLYYEFKYKWTTCSNTSFLRRSPVLLSRVNSKHRLQRIYLVACFLFLDKFLTQSILSPSSLRMSKLPRPRLCCSVSSHIHKMQNKRNDMSLYLDIRCLFDISFRNNLYYTTLSVITTIRSACLRAKENSCHISASCSPYLGLRDMK